MPARSLDAMLLGGDDSFPFTEKGNEGIVSYFRALAGIFGHHKYELCALRVGRLTDN
jgi:hypothetical protein